jgi:hypothetical protein
MVKKNICSRANNLMNKMDEQKLCPICGKHIHEGATLSPREGEDATTETLYCTCDTKE